MQSSLLLTIKRQLYTTVEQQQAKIGTYNKVKMKIAFRCGRIIYRPLSFKETKR